MFCLVSWREDLISFFFLEDAPEQIPALCSAGSVFFPALFPPDSSPAKSIITSFIAPGLNLSQDVVTASSLSCCNNIPVLAWHSDSGLHFHGLLQQTTDARFPSHPMPPACCLPLLADTSLPSQVPQLACWIFRFSSFILRRMPCLELCKPPEFGPWLGSWQIWYCLSSCSPPAPFAIA